MLRPLPAAITPLRFRILLGYLLVLVLGIYGWEQITSAWRYGVTLMAPVLALVGALFALKISAVVMSVFTLFSAFVKLFLGFLMVVIKPGVLKAIFVPQLLVLVNWLHRKSGRVQLWVSRIYDRGKELTGRLIDWWQAQALIDKVLLTGFLVPLFLVVLVVFIVKRAIAVFAFKKLTEQLVQKSTKAVIAHFHRVPIVGGVPAWLAAKVRRLTMQRDRADVVHDIKELGTELGVDNSAVDAGSQSGSSQSGA